MLRNLNQSFSGSRICGTPHMGVLASEILTGFTPPSLLENDIDVGDPEGCEYRMRIVGERPTGVIQFDLAENGTYIFDAPDGTYTYTQIVSKNGVDADPSVLEFQIGEVSLSVSSDMVVSYTVESSVSVVSADHTTTYQITTSVSADLNVGFQALNLVSADLASNYALLNFVSSELVVEYSTLSFVSSEVAVAYNIVPASQVFSSVVCSYLVLSDAVAYALVLKRTVKVKGENRICIVKAENRRVIIKG